MNSTFEGLKRVDHFDYPTYALRETLINTIVHRDYDYSGSTLISIFDDRIEFVSLGSLVKGINIEDIMGGISQPRNPGVANVFYRLELIESYGTGIQRIMGSYKGCMAKPKFRISPASFGVTLPKIKNDITLNDGTLNDGNNLSNEELILKTIATKGFITRKEAERIIGISRYQTITILNRLFCDGKIVKNGSGPAVKYMLP
jgi:ATP-dependent DNA helicase RecG